MRRWSTFLVLLVGLPCPGLARGWGPIQPHLPYTPSDTLLVFERLASRKGLGPGELSYRVLRCLPDGRFAPAPPVRLDVRYFTADKDSLAMEVARRTGNPIIQNTWEMNMDDPARFRARRHCYNPTFHHWAEFGMGLNLAIAYYELRTGVAGVRGASGRTHVVPDSDPEPLFCRYGQARRNNGLRLWDAQERTFCEDRYYEPASEFFRPQPQQGPIIFVYDFYGSNLDQEREDYGRPLRLLRLDRANRSLTIVASLPECRRVLGIAVDAEGGILVSAYYQTGQRLCRIDTLDGFSVRWMDSLPQPPQPYWGWSLSNVSAGRVLAICWLFTDARQERHLEAKLLDSRTLAPLWSGRVPGGFGEAHLAGNRLLIAHEATRLGDSTGEYAVDVRWDLYTLEPGIGGLELIPDAAPIEFATSPADPHFMHYESDIMAAIAGRGFLCWQEDSLTWLR